MILILSTSTDLDTEKVIEWLNFYNEPFFRLNDEDLMMGIVEFYYNPENLDQSYIKNHATKIFFRDIKKVWFRKFGFLTSYEKKFTRNSDFYKYLYSEFSATRKLIFELLSDKKWLYRKGVLPSKPMVLKKAKDHGLQIPKSVVTTDKNVLKQLDSNSNGLITKTIGEGKQVMLNEKNYPFMTIGIDDVDKVSQKFSPSYIQEKIEKEYEIRTFVIGKKLYSMAIFSQNDKRTEIDFRVFDPEKPIRFVPYKLPQDIEEKVINFMDDISLNTGSVDFIKSVNGEYVFLEVNPAGQFGMTSYPCNYAIHKEVANSLKQL
ncbi:grasp-with-spasm system ATP-grasp peptide maturase [Aquimarina sediminis]|uniref:grasp-with-spasm system ATP-grasp peptide maturase n=1 Tax=Aquimarina sediminis TaxID=2070536 RepID=UPI000CA02C2D|nr:grasp-with-spasm system ATP-grasp peptide maturase [Aquimarina sediminis]